MKKIRFIITIVVFALIIGGTSVWLLFKDVDEISSWERRKLQQFPEFSVSELQSGRFMRDFEAYLCDQFPLRDYFRRLKAKIHFDIFMQKDNSGIYIADGHAGKIDAVLSTTRVEDFNRKINKLYSMYLQNTGCRIYYSIIPDKNYFIAEKNGYPCFDYDELYSMVDGGLLPMTKIEIRDLLTIDDYYTTDSHWKQENILKVANEIRSKMGMGTDISYEEKNLGEFFGVYYGQSALPLKSDEIKYLTNEEIEGCITYNLETDKTARVYDMQKADSMDRYDIFLSGAVPFIEIANPAAQTKKELVIFRDSFGSSLAPLLVADYAKVTLIDTRYIMPELIGSYIEFENQDVLFIYSTMIVNNSGALK